jgi:hypothetical protein
MRAKPTKLLNLLLSLLLCVTPLAAQTTQADDSAPQQGLNLSPGAREVAVVIGVEPLLDRLAKAPGRTDGMMSLEALSLGQEITEAVVRASLEIDGVMAEIDNEIATLAAVRAKLEARRDRILLINNIASLVSGGVAGIAGTALQFSESTQTTGNTIGVTGSAVSTFLSFLGLRQQRGGQLALPSTTNMLAKPLGRAPGRHSDYPEEIWQYLSNVPPESQTGDTRRDELVKKWVATGLIETSSSPKAGQRIGSLTNTNEKPAKATIDLLNDRAAMLNDVRAKISIMKRDLSKLMLAIKAL